MRAEDGDTRATLLARREAALRRWPLKGAEFETEMTTVARALDQHARSLEVVDADPVERLRAWLAVGETYLKLGARHAVQYAAEAFRAAEAAAARAEADAHEVMQLKHQYGMTLLKLAADTNAELAAEAANRLSTALALARKHMPVGVASIKLELFRAEHTVATLRRPRRERRAERAQEAEAA